MVRHWSVYPLGQIDTRVYHLIKDVHRQIHQYDKGRQENDRPHNHRVVQRRDRLHEGPAQTGDVEHFLHHEAAAAAQTGSAS